MSTYFTGRRDPQRGGYVEQDDYAYIQPLYDSVLRQGLACIIFYDQLAPEFVAKYATGKIKFVQSSLGAYSLNDDRYFIFYEYLLRFGGQFKRVLLSDVSDVVVRASPFTLLEGREQKLFLGRSNIELIRHHHVKYTRIARFREDSGIDPPPAFYNMRLFNAGTVMASRPTLIYLLRQMIACFLVAPTDRNHNMTILNYCVFRYFLEEPRLTPPNLLGLRRVALKTNMMLEAKTGLSLLPARYLHDNSNYETEALFAGFPFTSAFKKFELDSTACLIHK